MIEQGKLQLWGHFHPPAEWTQTLSQEVYEALADADVYPSTLAEREHRNANPFNRMLDHLLAHNTRLPSWIDVPTPLAFTPAESNQEADN